MQFLYILFFLIISFSSLFSYEFSPDNSYNTPHVEIQLNNHNTQPSYNWHFSSNVKIIPHSGMQPANYSVVAHCGSPQLKHYFATTVAPLMYDATINNHYAAIPGYAFPDGLRHCKYQLSQFSVSDAALIASLSKRLETYCSYIEGILLNGKNYSFCDAISYKNQIKLVRVYANFLKEFYAGNAPYIFYEQSQTNPLMQRVMPSITWDKYDASDIKSRIKRIEQRIAASVNGNLGRVYKALHEGNSAQAYLIGQEHVKTVVRGKAHITSVFEKYPALRHKVEQVYHADKAKAEEACLARQAILKQEAEKAQAHYQAQNNEILFNKILIFWPIVIAQRWRSFLILNFIRKFINF